MPEPPPFATTPEHGRPETTTPPSRHRHGKTGASDSAHSSSPQPRLTRLAVLPAAVMAGISTAVTGTVLRLQEGTADAATWGVLAGGAVLGCGCLAVAVAAARKRARSDAKRAESLRQAITTGNWALDEDLTRLKRGEQLLSRGFAYQASRGEDPYQKLEYDVTEAQHRPGRRSSGRRATSSPPRTTTATRSRSSSTWPAGCSRSSTAPSVNWTIWRTRSRTRTCSGASSASTTWPPEYAGTPRNLAVLGGAVSRRQWTNPVTLTEVLRSSIAEVEQYSRVKLVPPIEGTLRGHAVADVIHLLAELVENATMFSHPDTQILLRSRRVTAGIAIEVEDRGLGIPQEDQARINTLLADPARIDVAKLLADGRIGLFVVSSLARRHGIAVQLQGNIYGGVQAILVLPQGLLGEEEGQGPVQAPVQVRPARPSRRRPRALLAGPVPRGSPGRRTVAARAPGSPAVRPVPRRSAVRFPGGTAAAVGRPGAAPVGRPARAGAARLRRTVRVPALGLRASDGRPARVGWVRWARQAHAAEAPRDGTPGPRAAAGTRPAPRGP